MAHGHFTHPQHIDDSHPEREGEEYREGGEERFDRAEQRAGLILDIRAAHKAVNAIRERGWESESLPRAELIAFDEHIADARKSLVAAVAALGMDWTPRG